jgi:hypothetical protein
MSRERGIAHYVAYFTSSLPIIIIIIIIIINEIVEC